jgi:ABC-type branched-subunit amino acid transport system ATPase component
VALDAALARGDLEAYGEAQERFEALGGWALEARLDEARRRLGIEHLDRATRLGRLSGGEAARCLLAAVTLGEPSVLLLDEPTAGMNPHESAELTDFMRKLRDEFELAILLIEHDMKVVMDVSERVTVLDHGIKIAEGPPEEVRADARVIEAYLGTSQ